MTLANTASPAAENTFSDALELASAITAVINEKDPDRATVDAAIRIVQANLQFFDTQALVRQSGVLDTQMAELRASAPVR